MSDDPAAPLRLPMAHFGAVGTPLPDPRIDPDGDFDPDDEELPESPPDVVMMLGFDPKDEPEPDSEGG